MIKVLVDSSVLIAATASLSGASALILGLARHKKIACYYTPKIFNEAQKNIQLKLSKHFLRFKLLIKKANLILLPEPPLEIILFCENVIDAKDAPIVAAALFYQMKYLISLDKKHFLTSKVKSVGRCFGVNILSPAEFIQTRKIKKLLNENQKN